MRSSRSRKLVDLAVAVGVVAERDRVGAHLEQLAAVFSVMPTPPAEFSPFTTTKSGRGASRRPGSSEAQRAPAETAHHVADEQELHQSDSAKLRRRGDERRPEQPRAGRAAVLEARGLTKRFGDREALRGVSLSAGRGRAGGGHRPERRRQDHAAVDPRRDPESRRGQRLEGPGGDRLGAAAGGALREAHRRREPARCSPGSSAVPDLADDGGADARADRTCATAPTTRWARSPAATASA